MISPKTHLMKTPLFILSFFFTHFLYAQTSLEFEEPVKQRVFVLTDITNEPDDQQSLVRFLSYANEYDIEGLVATTSTHLRNQTRKEKIEELVNSYAMVYPNLVKHAQDFPDPEDLKDKIKEHLPLYSMEGVGEGKDSPGSDFLIKAVDKADDRPLWVSVWGGANCLAQALWKVKETRTKEEVNKFVSKIKVYAISDQDFAGPWIRNNFPEIFYVVDPSAGDSYLEYYKATWTGISGDRFYKNGPQHHFDMVDNPWLNQHIIQDHGPLGKHYLESTYIMEGDTPSFIGLINNGLAWYVSPSYGGWGGRYEFYRSYAEKGKIWTSSVRTQDEILLPNGHQEASNQATIWRWREAYQNDFAARMDWQVTEDYKEANHHPVVVLNGQEGKSLAKGTVTAEKEVSLSAKGTHDPDGDIFSYRWFVYKEAGNLTGDIPFEQSTGEKLQFTMPNLPSGQVIHIILEVKDMGTPSLFTYRRVVLTNP